MTSTGLGDHCGRLCGGGPNLRCHRGNGEEGVDVRDLLDVEFMGLGNLNVEHQERGSNQELLQSLEPG